MVERMPPLGLQDFMAGLEVEIPDWIHTRTGANEPTPPIDVAATREALVDNLSQIHDPEIPVNIWDLGLIYELTVAESGDVKIVMTLTAPGCPVAGTMPPIVEQGARNVPGVTTCAVELTWDPPWHPGMASEDAKLALGFGV